MDLKILSWEYKNIRGVDKLSISLEKDLNTAHKINLIMMPNGYGKTTTQTLLRAIFDGKAGDWESDKIVGFKPPHSKECIGEFKVNLSIDTHIYVIILKLNYSNGTATYQTARVGDQGGLESGHKLPSILKSAFTEEFVKRFVFDGELAKDIIGEKSLEAERTIRYLYQLNRLGEMRERVKTIIEEKQNNMEKTKAKTGKGIARLKSEEKFLIDTLEKLENELTLLEVNNQSKQKELNVTNKEISEHIKSDDTLREQAEHLEKERNQVEKEIIDQTHSVLINFTNPFLLSNSIAEKLTVLSSKMQKLKLPRTMSRQFFEELADNDNCVCGRAIGETEKHIILNKSEEFLGEDQIGVINAIKSSIKGRNYSEELKEEVIALNTLIVRRNTVRSEWDKLQYTRAEAGDVRLQALEKKKSKLESEVIVLAEKLKVINTKDKFEKEKLDPSQNIPLCIEELSEVKDKIAEATDTVNLMNNAEKLNRILIEIEERTMEKLKERIKEETNEKLVKIIQAEHIEVEEIRGYLKLAGKSGASEGQSLAIAYSFLGSMFETSSHDLPFIVDSPAGSLDLSVRRQVSKIIPLLFDQLIVFITSGEREGFTDYFYSLEDEVNFLTIKKNDNQSICIEGLDEFSSFQGASEKR